MIVQEQLPKTPVIVIGGLHSSRIEQYLNQQKLPVQNLAEKLHIEVESAASIFTEK
jgi:hypothetical protein